MNIFKKFKLSGAAIAVAIGLIFAGGVAVASIPNADGTVSACYKNTDGTVKVIDGGQSCPNGYTALALSGPVSQTGVLYDAYRVQSPSSTIPAGVTSGYSVEAACAAGDKVLGGGYTTFATNDVPIKVTSSYPIPTADSVPTAWRVVFNQESDTESFSIVVHVLCAKVKS